jgi:hypothetical protein
VTDIFISHARADKKLVDAFVDLLVTGVGVSGKRGAIFATSVEGRGIGSAVDYRSHITSRLKDAKVAIFLVTPQYYKSTFCMAELAIAWGTGINSLIRLVPPLTPSKTKWFFGNLQLEKLDRAGLNTLCDHVQTTLKLGSDVARWDDRRDDFRKRLPALLAPSSRRSRRPAQSSASLSTEPLARFGAWSQRVVDGMLYIANGYTTIDIKAALLRDIDRGDVLSPVFSYLTNNGYHNWMALTDDPSYEYYSHAVELYRKRSGSLVDAITNAAGSTLDVISLGPGNGSKDKLFLRALARKQSPEHIFYYPFDVSESMISTSMRKVGQDSELSGISVKAILAEFGALPEFRALFHHRPGANIFMLLGNTIGNLSDERSFLKNLHNNAMSIGDILVLEVCNQTSSDPEGGYSDFNKRFDFGSLEYLGVEYEPDKLTYSPGEGPSRVVGTQTIIAQYKDCHIRSKWPEAITKDIEKVTLSYIHRYDPERLLELCGTLKFKYIDKFEHLSATTVVLQKTTDDA